MPSLPARIFLFLSSYAPLAATFVLLFWAKSPRVAALSAIVGLVGVLGMLIYLRVVSRITGEPTKVMECHSRDDATMSYLVTYIFPFLAFSFNEWQQAAALALFFLIVGFLYVTSDMIHINPTLRCCGYRLYDVTLEDGSSYSLIAHGRVRKGQMLSLIRVGDDVVLEKKR